MEINGPRTLLVLKPGSFGDILHTLPAVARLKASWPDCRISWLANTEWMPLLAGNPDVDAVIEFPRNGFRGWGGGLKAMRWVRSTFAGRPPDLALDFQGLLRSALIGRASGARTMLGLSDAREGARLFYRRTVPSPPQPIHAVERYLTLADAALQGGSQRIGGELTFPVPAGQPMNLFPEGEDFVLLHPYSRGKGKSMQKEQIETLLRKLSTTRVVLVGRGETAIDIRSSRCTNLLHQTTLPQLIWLTRRAAFVVSVDSGPAHLAAALGKPMVAIHSWSDPRKVGPYHPDAWVWKNGTLTQMRCLESMAPGFFEPKPLELHDADLEAIARLSTSPSNFSA